MKILICVKAMNNPGGGAERVLAMVASGLAERGHDVTILTFEPPGTPSFYPISPLLRHQGLAIGNTRHPATIAETLKRIRALRTHVRKFAPDVAIGFMHSMFVPLGIALLGTGIPMIASEHIVREHYKTRPVQAVLLTLTPLLAKQITVVSDQVRSSYPAWVRQRIVVAPNPVSIEDGSFADTLGSDRGRQRLLSVGRLCEQKDYTTLIEAFALVADRLPDWDLRIVGEGPSRPNLEEQVARLGLESRISLPGATAYIDREYSAAQLFVLPSHYESLGLVVAEALLHRLPAVGFADCPGVNTLIQPDINGLLAEGGIGRARNLADVLYRLMSNEDFRVKLTPVDGGLRGMFDVERVLDCWEQVLSPYVNT